MYAWISRLWVSMYILCMYVYIYIHIYIHIYIYGVTVPQPAGWESSLSRRTWQHPHPISVINFGGQKPEKIPPNLMSVTSTLYFPKIPSLTTFYLMLKICLSKKFTALKFQPAILIQLVIFFQKFRPFFKKYICNWWRLRNHPSKKVL